ncbi:probable inactive ATP-dependent zinc metalloprotease FTSHI 3, chloroplastic [Aristolochia californica]|uniref:probable inactive ATP-dependent zinc metalloprotease FTSHI 3, chloroplastic n=1 Tax=Aristolochia californica TaxID=171875 RepID=UPI0035D8B2D8
MQNFYRQKVHFALLFPSLHHGHSSFQIKMVLFSVDRNFSLMGTHVLCLNQTLLPCFRDKFRCQAVKLQCLEKYRASHASASLSCCHSNSTFMRSPFFRSSLNGSNCPRIMSSHVNSTRGSNQSQMELTENRQVRKRFSLRLRPRLWLFLVKLKRIEMKLKRESAGKILEEIRGWLHKNLKRVTLSTFVPFALGFCYLVLKLTSVPSPTTVPYSDLIINLQSGTVAKVLFEEGSRRIFYNTKPQEPDNSVSPISDYISKEIILENSSDAVVGDGSPISEQSKYGKTLKGSSKALTPEWQFCTRKIDHDENFLLSLMREKGTSYCSAPQSVLMSLRSVLFTILSLWIPLTPLMWLLYRQFSAANSPAKKRRPRNQKVGFDDVEGVDSAKTELMEIVSCLQGAINYSKLGARLPRGVLLVGPPGTGKTLLARAVAGEAGVPFFTVSASEFVELFVGRGAARIRDLFNVARKCAPSIIFIDELDAVGGKRGRSFNDERDQTLNQLLTEMDGFESEMKVVVIAATNRPEALDAALCRPGRFSRKVFVGEPDEDGRRKILAVHLRGVPLEEDQQLMCNLVASLTPGFVGADLANIVNEAALLAARRGGEKVSREDVMTAIERARYGINENQKNPNTIKKELSKLFSWIPVTNNDQKAGNWQAPAGYQTLS